MRKPNAPHPSPLHHKQALSVRICNTPSVRILKAKGTKNIFSLLYMYNYRANYLFFLAMLCGMWDPSSLTTDHTLEWKHGILNTGPPGKS